MTPEDAELLALARRFLALCRGQSAPSADTAATLATILTELRRMSDTLDTELAQLRADVAAQFSVIASATVAFTGLAAQIAAAEAAAKSAGATDAQISSLAAVRKGLEANTAALAAAIPVNTPAAAVPSSQPDAPAATAGLKPADAQGTPVTAG